MPRRFEVFVLWLCMALPVPAQVREQITVETVDVPVYVFNQGKPIRNLSKDDFQLYVNGKLQPIDFFEAVDFTERTPAAALPEAAPLPPQVQLRDRRLFVLLFDLVFKHPNLGAYAGALNRSRRAAVDMVDHALPGDFFAVAAVTRSGIRFATPFLYDHDAVRRAVLQLSPSNARDGLAISITVSEREMAETWGSGGGGRLGGEEALPDATAGSAALANDRELLLARDQIEGYGQVAARLRGLEGFKHVILFSDGQPFNPARESSAVKAMVAAFQSADVHLHTVDLTPIATGSDSAATSPASGAAQQRPSENPALLGNPYADWFAPKPGIIPASENESLFWISNETGGAWIHWKTQIAPALAELSASYSAVYRLGFKPVSARKGRNDVNVKVKNLPPGTRLSFRKGFSTTVPSKAAGPDPFLLADIIQNDTPQSGTPPEISLADRRVDVIVPVVQLSKQFGRVDGARAMLYVFDAKGVPVISTEKTFLIPKDAARDRVLQQKLNLAPGNYVAKVLLRVGDSLAFAKRPFEIAVVPTQ